MAAAGRRRRAAALGRRRRAARPAATPSRPGSTPRTPGGGFLPSAGTGAGAAEPGPPRTCASTPALRRARSSAPTTTRCWPRSSRGAPTEPQRCAGCARPWPPPRCSASPPTSASCGGCSRHPDVVAGRLDTGLVERDAAALAGRPCPTEVVAAGRPARRVLLAAPAGPAVDPWDRGRTAGGWPARRRSPPSWRVDGEVIDAGRVRHRRPSGSGRPRRCRPGPGWPAATWSSKWRRRPGAYAFATDGDASGSGATATPGRLTRLRRDLAGAARPARRGHADQPHAGHRAGGEGRPQGDAVRAGQAAGDGGGHEDGARDHRPARRHRRARYWSTPESRSPWTSCWPWSRHRGRTREQRRPQRPSRVATCPRGSTSTRSAPATGCRTRRPSVPTEVKAEFIARLAGAGLRTVEATSFVHPKWVPQLADAEELFPLLERRPGRPLPGAGAERGGLDRALAPAPGEIAVFASATESFARRNLNRTVDESLAMFAPVVARPARTACGSAAICRCASATPGRATCPSARWSTSPSG